MTIYKDPSQKNDDAIVANSVKIFSLVGNKCAVASSYDVTVHAEDKAAAITRLAINEASRPNYGLFTATLCDRALKQN